MEETTCAMYGTDVPRRVVVVNLVARAEGEAVLFVEDGLCLFAGQVAGEEDVQLWSRMIRVSELCGWL